MDSNESNEVSTEFYLAVDDVLNHVQGLSDKIPRQQLSAVILYAAARYNAYNWIFREGNEEQLADDASEWFSTQYGKMFTENADTLSDIFKEQGVIK